MTWVRVVEPVVVISDVVRTWLALHTTHGWLTSIPEVNVWNGNKLRVRLNIDGAITLLLVTSLIRTIEYIYVVNPNVRVICIKRYTIVNACLNSNVTNLHTLCVTNEEAETIDNSIVTHALYSHVKFWISCLTLNLQTLSLATEVIHIRICNSSYDTKSNRSLILTLLISSYNSLKTSAGSLATLSVGGHLGRDCLCCLWRYIEHLCSALQSTIIIICTYTWIVEVSKSWTVKALYLHSRWCLASISSLLYFIFYRYNLQYVVACGQSHSLYTAIVAIRTQQLSVKLCPWRTAITRHIAVVTVIRIAETCEFHPTALIPSTLTLNGKSSRCCQCHDKHRDKSKKLFHKCYVFVSYNSS